jgi:hypothetical protein
MKLTKSKLKQVIKEELNETYDKRSELERYVGELARASGRDYNEVMHRLKKLFNV